MLAPANRNLSANLTVLIAVPTLESGAADTNALDLVKLLHGAGHRPVVVSSGGRLTGAVTANGGEFIAMDVASKNPVVMVACVRKLSRLIGQRGCDVVHALGRAPAWSAYAAARINGKPFVTTWYKGFREQNVLKRLYNGVMAKGDRVVAASEDIADLIRDRYDTPLSRLTVLPTIFDAAQFDPKTVALERIERLRHAWGVSPSCRVLLAPGRMVRRKGHHLIVKAAARLKAAGVKDFMVVFTGEDHGRTSYTGELWDLIAATGTNDVVRLAGLSGDLPAAFAASAAAVFASTQTEGTQRAVLGAQAMGLPAIVSDLSAGPDIVLSPPSVSEERMTGLRFTSGDSAALAGALIKMLGLPETTRRAIGTRARDWVLAHHDAQALADRTLRLYVDLASAHSRERTT
ncbi:MAG: glycosyltransferase [Xanthobacteraceae bacterium]|nr:glycosyltransferase [Xanthobacteraceae bacterium]